MPTFPARVFWRYGKILAFYRPFDGLYLIAAIELFFIIFYLCILVYSINKIRFSYWLFFAMSILIPSLTGTFAGMPRYGLHLYHFFLSVAMLLEKRPLMVKATYVAISLALLFIGICYFTRGDFFA